MPEDDLKASDWHEQAIYAKQYFDLSLRCRSYQEQGDPLAWFNAFQSKLSFCSGVLEGEEIQKIKEFREQGKELRRQYLLVTQNERIEQKYSYDPSKSINVQAILTKIDDLLFEAEGVIDRIVNKKMPFLNLKQKADIEGM